jgi:hypothetical protein
MYICMHRQMEKRDFFLKKENESDHYAYYCKTIIVEMHYISLHLTKSITKGKTKSIRIVKDNDTCHLNQSSIQPR